MIFIVAAVRQNSTCQKSADVAISRIIREWLRCAVNRDGRRQRRSRKRANIRINLLALMMMDGTVDTTDFFIDGY